MSILKTLNFSKIDAGPVQVVDEMTVVPLVGENRGNVAEPFSLKFERTSNYGSMVYKNIDEEKAAIVPLNLMVRGPGAQDHAMSGSGIVSANKTYTFKNACCIESSQGGLLSDKDNEYDILPIELRKKLLPVNIRNGYSFNKLWPDIEKWLSGLGVGRSAHLRYFYDNKQIKQSLEEFSSEFEPVIGQIGAVILFQENIVGIEIMPSTDHWMAYWKLLIRGCYGAELLRMKKLKLIREATLQMPSFPKVITDPTELTKIVENFTDGIRQDVIKKLDAISIKSSSFIEYNKDGFETVLLETKTGGGDLIIQNHEPIYLSMVV
jgi:hypothetical protein